MCELSRIASDNNTETWFPPVVAGSRRSWGLSFSGSLAQGATRNPDKTIIEGISHKDGLCFEHPYAYDGVKSVICRPAFQ